MAIYLDHNATTPLDPRVLEAMLPYMQGIYGNASSVHRYGRLVRGAIDTAREQVASLVGAHPSEVIFTASGTEANNLALKGYTQAYSGEAKCLLIGCGEHASLRDPAMSLVHSGWQIDELGCDALGRYQPEALHRALKNPTGMLSLMAANNETGVIQPMSELAEIAKQHDVVMHVDATQAAGKVSVSFADLGVQLMTVSSHKIYGPLGAGALITDKSSTLMPQILGGGQEKDLRSGTENVAAIVGFGKAAELALNELTERQEKTRSLRDKVEAGLNAIPQAIIFAEDAERLSNTVQFGLIGFHGEATLMKLDCKGIAVSSGSACHADRVEPSHVLTSMGVDDETALTAIRVTVGKDTTEVEIDSLLHAVNGIVSSPLHSAAMAAQLA